MTVYSGLGPVAVSVHCVEPVLWLVDLSMKVTVVLTVALVADRLLRHAEARTRHALWSAALFGTLVMPLVSAVTPKCPWPGWSAPLPRIVTPDDIGSPSPFTSRPPRAAEWVMADAASGPGAAPRHAIPDAVGAVRILIGPPTHWVGLILALWMAGAVVMLGRLVLGVARVTRLTRRGTPLGDDRWHHVTARLICEGQLLQHIRLLENRDVRIPFTFGLFQPVILLPTDVESWSDQRRRLVLLHELSHITLNHWSVYIAAQFARALYWFHPLVWVAVGRLHTEQEQACDERVVRLGARPSAYAAHLVEISHSMTPARALPVATWTATRRSTLERRVRSVLRPGGVQHHRRLQSSIVQAGMGVSVLSAAVLSSTDPRTSIQLLPAITGGNRYSALSYEDMTQPATNADAVGTVETTASVVAGGRQVFTGARIPIGPLGNDSETTPIQQIQQAIPLTPPLRIANRIQQRIDDRTCRSAEDYVARCVSTTIVRTISASIAASIYELMAVSIAPPVPTESSGGKP